MDCKKPLDRDSLRGFSARGKFPSLLDTYSTFDEYLLNKC